MALSIRNFRIPRNNSFLLQNKHQVNLPHRNSLRHLRGSKNGRILYRTEAKFQELLKNLNKLTENSVVNITEIPELIVNSANHQQPHDEKPPEIKAELVDPHNFNLLETKDSTNEEMAKRLEEKITPLKNYTYAKQLEKKYNKCLSMLRLFGQKLSQAKVPITMGSDKLPCPVELMLPSPIIESYRNQDEFSIGTDINGNSKTVGFFLEHPDDDSKTVCVSPEKLVIIRENHKRFVKDFEQYIRNSPLPASTVHGDGGFWRAVKVKSNVDGTLMGTVSVYAKNLPQQTQLLEEQEKLMKYFATSGESYNLKSFYIQKCSPKKPSRPMFTPREDERSELLFGDRFTEKMDNVKLYISPESYFLPNTVVTGSMYNILQKICKMNDSMNILDIFCGVGAASLVFSNHVKKCIGVDICFRNLTDAIHNIQLNGKKNIVFQRRSPEDELHYLNEREYYDDLIAVISPGRSEISIPAIKYLRRCKDLSKIIYITTKPRIAVDNFVRLCKPAAGEGYLGKPFVPLIALPVDMLPQTEHYALALVFQRF